MDQTVGSRSALKRNYVSVKLYRSSMVTQTEKIGDNLNVVMASKYKNIGAYKDRSPQEEEKK